MRRLFAILSLLVVAAGCNDAPTVAAPDLLPADAPDAAKKWKNSYTFAVPVVGTLPGGTFVGTATIRKLELNKAGELVAKGFVTGVATIGTTVTEIHRQNFETVAELTAGGDVVDLSKAPLTPSMLLKASGSAEVSAEGSAPMAQEGPNEPLVCDVLFLDLGPLDLNLLGLQVDLSRIILDIDAIPGAGNLVGNLLCVVVSLLDGPGIFLQLLQGLLDFINSILN